MQQNFPDLTKLSAEQKDALIAELIAQVSDSTTDHAVERGAREDQARLRSIINNSVSLMAVKDTAGRYQFANPRFERSFGFTPGQVIGKTDAELFPPAMTVLMRACDAEITSQHTSIEREEVLQLDGDARHCLVMRFPLFDDDGTLVGIGFQANDISERKEIEEGLQRSNAELEQFAYGMSHDMRQPLRMITSYLQLLTMNLTGQLNLEQREYFNFAIEGAKRLDQMLVSLLEYSRVGRLYEPKQWLDSKALLDEALLFLQPAIVEAQAEVRIIGEWPRAFVSRDELTRLLQNLIGNAVKFRVAGRTPIITVSSETADAEWQLYISDNGIGIDPEQIGRLFQVFQRLQARSNYEGSGIGLALCRRIVEHQGGRIWVESTGENEGCRFFVALPLPGEPSACEGRVDA